MEFTVKITKKDVIIGVLTSLLLIVTFCKVRWGDEPNTTSNILQYGMIDDDINYTIIYDQVNNVSKVSAELFGNSDTINVDGVYFVKIKPVSDAKTRAIILRERNEDRDSIKVIRG